MNVNPSIRLISIVGRWDQPIFPPPRPFSPLIELITHDGPLRPQARVLQQQQERRHVPR